MLRSLLFSGSILQTMLSFNLQAMGLLQHLKSYKRISPPSDVENTYLLENSLLPNPLSSIRLPFHLLMQTKHYWKIICELRTIVFTFVLQNQSNYC